MQRVTDIGGIFFKAKDPAAMQAWYERHLGIDVQDWGGAAFSWADSEGKPTGGTTIWSIGKEDVTSSAPSNASFMINYRVEDLHALVARLKAEGCNVLDKTDESEFGKFAWVIDPEGNTEHPPRTNARLPPSPPRLSPTAHGPAGNVLFHEPIQSSNPSTWAPATPHFLQHERYLMERDSIE